MTAREWARYLSRELQADLVAAVAVAHEVLAQLSVRQHDVTEVEGSCRAAHVQHLFIIPPHPYFASSLTMHFDIFILRPQLCCC